MERLGQHRRTAGALTLAFVVFLAVYFIVGGTSGKSALSASPTTSTSGAGTTATGTPVPLGTPQNPLVGDDGNTNPVLSTVKSWPDLGKAAQNNTSYQACLQSRIQVDWSQAQQIASFVNQGHDFRRILVSNSPVSDEQARAILAAKNIPNVANLPIIRVNGFTNTEGLPSNGCQPFRDNRSQIRLTLTVPIDVNDLSKGVHQDKGVLGLCSNPWNLIPPSPGSPVVSPPTTQQTSPTSTPPPATTPTTRARPVTTTTSMVCPPGQHGASGKCISADTLPEPPTTTAPSHTTTSTTRPTVPTPTTESPPATAPPTTEMTSPPTSITVP